MPDKIYTDYKQFKDANSIEEILCLSALIATGNINHSARVIDARDYFDSIGTCDSCPANNRCLACIINE